MIDKIQKDICINMIILWEEIINEFFFYNNLCKNNILEIKSVLYTIKNKKNNSNVFEKTNNELYGEQMKTTLAFLKKSQLMYINKFLFDINLIFSDIFEKEIRFTNLNKLDILYELIKEYTNKCINNDIQDGDNFVNLYKINIDTINLNAFKIEKTIYDVIILYNKSIKYLAALSELSKNMYIGIY